MARSFVTWKKFTVGCLSTIGSGVRCQPRPQCLPASFLARWRTRLFAAAGAVALWVGMRGIYRHSVLKRRASAGEVTVEPCFSSGGKFITITWGLCVGRCAAFWCIAHVTSTTGPRYWTRGGSDTSQSLHDYSHTKHRLPRGHVQITTYVVATSHWHTPRAICTVPRAAFGTCTGRIPPRPSGRHLMS